MMGAGHRQGWPVTTQTKGAAPPLYTVDRESAGAEIRNKIRKEMRKDKKKNKIIKRRDYTLYAPADRGFGEIRKILNCRKRS